MSRAVRNNNNAPLSTPIDNSASSNPSNVRGPPNQPSGEKDKLTQVTVKVDEVKLTLQSNLKKAVERGETLEAMDIKSHRLMEDADKFNDGAKNVRQMMCRRNARLFILIGVILIIIIGLIIWASTS